MIISSVRYSNSLYKNLWFLQIMLGYQNQYKRHTYIWSNVIAYVLCHTCATTTSNYCIYCIATFAMHSSQMTQPNRITPFLPSPLLFFVKKFIKVFLQCRCQQWELNLLSYNRRQFGKQLKFWAFLHVIILIVIIFLKGKICILAVFYLCRCELKNDWSQWATLKMLWCGK